MESINTAVITGGLGFIGSTLAKRLCSAGVNVHIVDNSMPGYGSNEKNIDSFSSQVDVHSIDVRNEKQVKELVKKINPNRVFHLAAQLSRPKSLSDPELDIEINCIGLINVIKSVIECQSNPQIVFTSSQAVYGPAPDLPLTEKTDPRPIDIYGSNKLACERYLKVYHKTDNINYTILRLSNVYGPRSQLSNPKYGVINKFLKQSLTDDTLTVFSPGTMERDFIFIDDVIDAIITVTTDKKCQNETFLIGSGNSITIKSLADKITNINGQGNVKMTEWPEDWSGIKIGDIQISSEKLTSKSDWEPSTSIDEGLVKTLKYYQSNLEEYI